MKSRLLSLVAVVGLICGCGGGGPDDAPELGKISGVANFEGKPLAEATVTFFPEKGPPAIGITDASGAFQLKTNGQLGAAVGKHKVTVSTVDADAPPPAMDGNETKTAQKSTLPKKYSSVETTDLLVEVPSGGNDKLVLDLTK